MTLNVILRGSNAVEASKAFIPNLMATMLVCARLEGTFTLLLKRGVKMGLVKQPLVQIIGPEPEGVRILIAGNPVIHCFSCLLSSPNYSSEKILSSLQSIAAEGKYFCPMCGPQPREVSRGEKNSWNERVRIEWNPSPQVFKNLLYIARALKSK